MQYTHKPGKYWNDFVHVETELLAFIEEYGTLGIMPIEKELFQAGRGDLAKAIRKHKGVEAVAQRLGLQLPSHKRKRHGYWDDFANVAQRLGLRLSHAQRPDGYWDDFANIERKLFTYIEEHGTQGVMPSRAELTKMGLGDLAGAFDKYGGSSAVAERLGLQMKIKPMGHWDDFTNVESALSAYIAERGTPGVMPTASELQKAGQNSLVIAMTQKHGGMACVAERLGLQLSYTGKPSGYWDNHAHIELAIHEFNEARGMPGLMPTGGELRKAGRDDLASAITNHGGFPALAEQFGLRYTNSAKPAQYWDDFTNVERELLDFIHIQGTKGVMPTADELGKSGRSNLVFAINKHGGFPTIAERLGLQLSYKKKPDGYWDDFDNVKQELLGFITEQGTPGTMPTNKDLADAGRSDLTFAINKHRGMSTVAERLGLQLSYSQKPDGYWDDFANLKEELLQFIEVYGTPGMMPTHTDLRDAGKHDLNTALSKHEGLLTVAERLGLELSYTRKRPGYWNDFANVRQALLDFVEEHGTPSMMPTRSELQEAGRGDLIKAIDAQGGVLVVAERIGFAYTVKPDGYWDDFAKVKEALLQFIEEHGTPGMMPTTRELREGGQAALQSALDRHGGLSAVARSLGLHCISKEHITSHTAAIVERLARSIQPLAESNLLSGAQVMIIQRRAGMLDYRNPRIKQLNASLASGNHDAIELALTQLRNAPEEETADFSGDEETLFQQDPVEIGLEAVVGSDLPIEEDSPFSPADSTHTVPDLHQEQAAIRGLSALGTIRLPLDEVLGLLTSKILWEAFYKRLYAWYGSLHTTQTVAAEDVLAAILSAYAGQMDNEFVVQAAAKFTQEVEQAVNFATRLALYRWTGPHLRLHQADAARRMTDILIKKAPSAFLLDADDPGMGKSASFLAAVAASGIRRIILLAPKTVADDTWADPRGEIRTCLAHASIVRGLRKALDADSSLSGTSPVFFVLHYEELLNDEMVDRLVGEQFDCLCIDEVHLVKQRGGQKETYRREALEKIRAAAQSAIGLTGTPLVNELAEPLSLLQVLSNRDHQFDYTRLKNHRMGDIADVFEAILPHIVRRRKKDVLLHLPLCDVRPVVQNRQENCSC